METLRVGVPPFSLLFIFSVFFLSLSFFFLLWNELCSAVMMEKRLSSGSTVPSLRPFLTSWIVLNCWAPSEDFHAWTTGCLWFLSKSEITCKTLLSKGKSKVRLLNFRGGWLKESKNLKWHKCRGTTVLCSCLYFSVAPRGYPSLLCLTKKAARRLHAVGIHSLDVTCPGDVSCTGGCPSLRRVLSVESSGYLALIFTSSQILI